MSGNVEYSEELADKICLEIATGSSVRPAAEKHGVSERAFYLWLTKHDYLVQNYARAREFRADFRFESSSDLMRDLRMGLIDPAQARIMLDEIKWKCGKESSKKYGDKIQNENRQVDKDGNDVNVTINVGAKPNG